MSVGPHFLGVRVHSAHDEAGVRPKIDHLAEERFPFWGIVRAARQEPVKSGVALPHGRQLAHEDIPLENQHSRILDLVPLRLQIVPKLALRSGETVLPLQGTLLHREIDLLRAPLPEGSDNVLQSRSAVLIDVIHAVPHFRAVHDRAGNFHGTFLGSFLGI